MAWMTCALPFPGTDTGLQDRFEAIFMALQAPRGAALFGRTTEDFASEIFLISPRAAAIPAVRSLAEWAEEPNPFVYRWSGLVFDNRDLASLGITLGEGKTGPH